MKAKKTLALLLALILALGMLPLPNAAAEEKCTIRFDGNLSSDQIFAPIEVPKDSTLEGVELPVPWGLSDWQFDGWSKYQRGWDRKLDPQEPVTEDLTLYAVWLRRLEEATVYVPTPTAGMSARYTEEPAAFGWWNYYTVEPGSYWTQISDALHPEAAYTGEFEAGKTYYGSFEIVPEDGFFAVSGGYNATELTLVGGAKLEFSEVLEKEDRETLYVVYSVTVPEVRRIDRAELFVDRIVSYSTADRFCRRACLTSGLSIEPIDTWWASEEEIGDYAKKLQPSDGMMPGETYYSYFMLFTDGENEIDYDSFTAAVYGGRFLSARRDEDAYEPTVIVNFAVDVLDVCAMTVLVESDAPGGEYVGAYTSDLDPRWESYIDGPSVPVGVRSFTAKAHSGYVFDGWYEAEIDEYSAPTGKETLLTHSATLEILHDREQRVHCRFTVDPTTLSELVVCGVPVTSENAGDILGDGVFSYDAAAKTLHIRGDESYYGSAIVSSVQGLTIDVAQDSILRETEESDAVDFLTFCGDTVITGAGKLTLRSTKAPFCVSVLNNATLTLDGLRGEFFCRAYGISGNEDKEALVIKNCSLTVECAPEKAFAVDFFGSITLEGCRVSFPHNALVKNVAIFDAEGRPASKLVIVKGDGGFSDVPPEAYYAEPVAWALANGVTTGKTETTFAPNDDCTRAQIVTFLWRADGCPEPKKGPGSNSPFVDVKETAYYYKAVLWAIEAGITNGMDETHFGPNDACTRAQAVTFLHRAAGTPAPTGGVNPFGDVAAGKFFCNAVLWAVENGVTKGTSADAFSPDATCTRGQIVTFLFRAGNGT